MKEKNEYPHWDMAATYRVGDKVLFRGKVETISSDDCLGIPPLSAMDEDEKRMIRNSMHWKTKELHSAWNEFRNEFLESFSFLKIKQR